MASQTVTQGLGGGGPQGSQAEFPGSGGQAAGSTQHVPGAPSSQGPLANCSCAQVVPSSSQGIFPGPPQAMAPCAHCPGTLAVTPD
jgi:hypothetical protein